MKKIILLVLALASVSSLSGCVWPWGPHDGGGGGPAQGPGGGGGGGGSRPGP